MTRRAVAAQPFKRRSETRWRATISASIVALGLAAVMVGPAQAARLGAPPLDPASLAQSTIATCRTAAQEYAISAPVFSVGPVVCVYGDINRAMADAFLQLDLSATDAVVLSSPGGSVASALDMVEHMGLDRQTIVVDQLCASSCANYLFLAARWKIVPDDAMVAWHGAPPNPRLWSPPAEMGPTATATALNTMWRSEDFFFRVGVSDRVAREAPDGIDITALQPGSFWSHSRANLEWRYGIGGILMAPDTDRAVQTSAAGP